VGLELPAALTEPLSWIGMTWPEADEDKLFEAGQRWIAYGSELRGIATDADNTAESVWSTNSGQTVDEFQRWWQQGPERHLDDDATAAEIIGAALIAFAVITLALKIAYIIQLIILAIEVAQAIATAIATFGATAAEVPGFIAATRAICRQLLKQVVEHVQTFLKDLFEKAKNLLKIFSKDGRAAAGDLEKDIPAAMRTKRYDGKPMLDRYRFETDGTHPANPFRPRAVNRLSDADRDAYRVYVDDNGIMRSAKDGAPFDTRTGATAHSGGGRAIFVMDEQGNIYASNYQEVGVFHHSTLGNGQPVAAAGELSVVDGRVQHVTAASGHYQPGPAQMQQFVNELGRNGIDNVPVYDFTGTNRWF
jgi:hypothetical protein